MKVSCAETEYLRYIVVICCITKIVVVKGVVSNGRSLVCPALENTGCLKSKYTL